MTDTRPALTARWRALERRGWRFSIRPERRYADYIYPRSLLGENHSGEWNSSLSQPIHYSSIIDNELRLLEYFEYQNAVGPLLLVNPLPDKYYVVRPDWRYDG